MRGGTTLHLLILWSVLVWSFNGTTSTFINQFSVLSVGSPKHFMSCTLDILIQEFFYLSFFIPPEIFQMKTSKTLKSHMSNQCHCSFPRNPLYLMFDPHFSSFSPSGSCHLSRWPPAGRAACLSSPWVHGAPQTWCKCTTSLHEPVGELGYWVVTTQRLPEGPEDERMWDLIMMHFSDVMVSHTGFIYDKDKNK
jgi:hypothetical protein